MRGNFAGMSESAGAVPVPRIRSGWGLNRERRLAELAAAGDERAFEALFRRYHQELYRYCRAIVNDPADAEDAMQATMVKALRSLPGERREISLKPWLYRVAHNESISILRSRRTTVELDAEQLPALDTVEATADLRGRVRTLVADLETLPERQRASLVMRELNGLSYDEIGAALAMSPAASRQAVFEARTALLEVAEGREMECRHARETISAGDRRVLRGRRLRAHLRGCEGCRDFEAAIRERRETLAALAPPLAAPAAFAVLQGAIGAGSTGTGALVTGLAGGAVAKTAVTVLAVAAIGGGAAATGVLDRGGDARAPDREPAAAPAQPSSPAPADPAANFGAPPVGGSAGPASGIRADGGQAGNGGRGSQSNANPGGSSHGARGNSANAPGQDVSANPPSSAPGQAGTAPGQAHSNAAGGGSATAPGQTGAAPGQANAAAGGSSATAPGQTGASPGTSESAPGHTSAPAATTSPPEPQGNAVGHATAPGQADK